MHHHFYPVFLLGLGAAVLLGGLAGLVFAAIVNRAFSRAGGQ